MALQCATDIQRQKPTLQVEATAKFFFMTNKIYLKTQSVLGFLELIQVFQMQHAMHRQLYGFRAYMNFMVIPSKIKLI